MEAVMEQVIYPPDIVEISGRVIFLAGPIQGAENWQRQAMEIIPSLKSVTIANPRRDYLDLKFDYNRQVDWETYYLRQAAMCGVIMFWLAKEHHHSCKRAYAQTTRFELAEWITRHQYDSTIKIVVGIEEGFTNSRYIQRRLSQDCPRIAICHSLPDTCCWAVDLL